MANNITEEFQIDLGNPAAFKHHTNVDVQYDVAIDGVPFVMKADDNYPYQRQTAEYKKQQFDNTNEAGEQSLSGWWLRSQSSFHYGAGINFYEPAQDEKLRYRFKESQGVSPWTIGEVSLLNDTNEGHIVTATDPDKTQLRPIKYVRSGNTYSAALLHDEYDLDKVYDPISSTVTGSQLTSNVVTLTLPTGHGLSAGMEIVVTGVGAPYDGTFTATAASGTSISYAVTSANIPFSSESGSIVSNITHFVNFNSGTSSPIYAACDDGEYVYFVATDTADPSKKTYTYRKPVAGDETTGTANGGTVTGDVTIMFYSSNVVQMALTEWVKGRVVAAAKYDIGGGDTESRVFAYTRGTTALPAAIFTAPKGTVWTGITASAADIYISGYIGDSSVIYRLPLKDDGTFTTLSAGIVVAEMPRGEVIHSIKAYLGYMAIGTTRGVRIAQILDAGGLIYGPLLFESPQTCNGFAVNGTFLWAACGVGTDTGLVRIDLSSQIDTLRFPYANDLQAIGVNHPTSAVAFLDGTNQLVFTCSALNGDYGHVYTEALDRKRQFGWITTGRIRFNTIEDKFFKYIRERASYPAGSLTVSTIDREGVEYALFENGMQFNNRDIGVQPSRAQEFMSFKFTLQRDSVDTNTAPTLYGYQVKALPAAQKQRLIQYHLLCYDTEQDRLNNKTGYTGRAYERISRLENIESLADVVNVQDLRTGETFNAQIEQMSFRSVTSPDRRFNGFGGLITIVVRKL